MHLFIKLLRIMFELEKLPTRPAYLYIVLEANLK